MSKEPLSAMYSAATVCAAMGLFVAAPLAAASAILSAQPGDYTEAVCAFDSVDQCRTATGLASMKSIRIVNASVSELDGFSCVGTDVDSCIALPLPSSGRPGTKAVFDAGTAPNRPILSP